MVHREFHWHATESCFYCENCQVQYFNNLIEQVTNTFNLQIQPKFFILGFTVKNR